MIAAVAFSCSQNYFGITAAAAAVVCVRDSVHVWRPAGRKTRIGTLTRDIFVSEEIVANFLDRGFLT